MVRTRTLIRWTLTALLLLLLQGLAVADPDQDLRDGLRKTMVHNIVVLKHFYRDDTIRFDSAGKLIESSNLGPWTVYAKLRIDNIHLEHRALRIEGRRIAVRFDGSGHPNDLLSSDRCTIFIPLTETINDSAIVQSAVPQLFLGPNEKLSSFVPDYWKASLSAMEETGSAFVLKDRTDWHPMTAKIGGDVLPPRAIYAPDPEYTDPARNARLQGTIVFQMVVTEAGEVGDFLLERPLGLGLDDQAAAALRTWKFKPATKGGKPIAARLHVEVNFHLYR